VPKTSNKHQTPRKLTEKSYKNNVEVGNFRNKPQQLGSQRSQAISTCRGQNEIAKRMEKMEWENDKWKMEN